jgi:molecular chaperone GrpE
MENQDTVHTNQHPATPPTDSLTDSEAIAANGGTPDDAELVETEEVVTTDEAETTAEPTQTNTAATELAELKDKYLRLYADFENLRRRTAKEKMELVKTANESLLLDLLPVVDDFGRAMQALDSTGDLPALKEGIILIFNKMTRTLEAKGLKPMVAKGEVFNADLHESVTQFPAPTEDMKGKVIDEIERGYYLQDKVIRFAKVIVGN